MSIFPQVMEMFESMLDPSEIFWITRSVYPNGTTRGQILVSPSGMAKIADGADGRFPWDRGEPN